MLLWPARRSSQTAVTVALSSFFGRYELAPRVTLSQLVPVPMDSVGIVDWRIWALFGSLPLLRPPLL